ncbi:hypothetical protein GCM10022252_76810 [Streptosporangium oxazolinicum]|uniref:SIS domain-containing protein n=2 Tax=Streptosporangium oxazolinicum TaxID=909287 RepID=A0ABP8BLF7_9ACTN
MAARFHLGGKLIVFGDAGADAAHVAVEFMHPVIVGKRALPAVALSTDATTAGGVNDEDGDEVLAHRVRHWADAADTALGISRDIRCPSVLRGLETAGELGLLTIALTGAGDHGAGGGEGTGPLPAGHTTTEHTTTEHTLTTHSTTTHNTTTHGTTAHGTTAHTVTAHPLTGRLPADHVLVAASDDPAVVKEVHVTAYHLLWELVHVFLDRLGPPARGAER